MVRIARKLRPREIVPRKPEGNAFSGKDKFAPHLIPKDAMHSADYDEFLRQVKLHTCLSDAAAVSHSISATLETLAEYVTSKCAAKIAAHLPTELRTYFLKPQNLPRSFSLRAFFLRVSARENSTYLSGIFHARAILEVLAHTIPMSALSEIESLLPKEIGTVFHREKGPPESAKTKDWSFDQKPRLLCI